MRIRGCRSGRCGLCSRWSTGAWTSRGWRAWPRISAAPATTRIRRGGLGGSARFGISRSCSIATRCIGRRWCAPGRGARTDGRCRCRRGVAGGAVAAAARADRGAGSGRAGRGRVRAAAGGAGARRPAGAAVAVRADAAAGGASQRAARARGRARRARLHAPSVAGAVGAGRRSSEVSRSSARREDPTAALPANRLLASWGQDAREMQLVLGGRRATSTITTPSSTRTGTLLAHLQADVRADRWPAGAPLPGEDGRAAGAGRRAIAASQVHACHGRARQVEVLRDAILHLLDDDPTLEPRDVIVMCPDIETFAPLIQATFGAGEVFDDDDELDALPADVRPPDLRVRLADRSLRQTNPVLGVVARLLDLVDERLTASQVLDFADQEPVRRRFGLDDDDLARIEDWVAASGIRWGLDARAPGAVQARRARRGDVARGRGPAAGRRDDDRGRAAAVPRRPPARRRRQRRDRSRRALRRARRSAADERSTRSARPRRSTPGPTAIADAADALTATTERDAWQRAELDRLLGDVVDEAGPATAARPSSRRPRSARCSPSGSRAARRGRTSAPAT